MPGPSTQGCHRCSHRHEPSLTRGLHEANLVCVAVPQLASPSTKKVISTPVSPAGHLALVMKGTSVAKAGADGNGRRWQVQWLCLRGIWKLRHTWLAKDTQVKVNATISFTGHKRAPAPHVPLVIKRACVSLTASCRDRVPPDRHWWLTPGILGKARVGETPIT